MRDAALISLAALTMLSCRAAPPGILPERAVPVHVDTSPVPLDSRDSGRRAIGSFTYAGGIEIITVGAAAVRELSDLRIVEGQRLVAVSDGGSFFEARLRFDERDRLTGLADAHLIPLVDTRGDPLTGAEADAEGLALLPGGDRLVSFERNHRIWLYPADGGRPRPAPAPDGTFPPNEGMEALAHYPAAGPDAYLVGIEDGTIWLCRVSTACEGTPLGTHVPQGFGLTALSAYGDDGAFALLARAYDPVRGVRIVVRLVSVTDARAGQVIDEMTMAAPLTVDNFEGIAVVPQGSGGIRLYLLSDDNGSETQRTYLLAFDWLPG